MRKLVTSSSLSTYLDHLEFTEAALAASDHTAGLALGFGAAITEWEDVAKRERASRRAVTRAEAVVGVLDQVLDELTAAFAGQLLVEAKQDRKSTLFRRFFPTTPSDFMRGNLRNQCEVTRDRILAELGKLDASSPLRAHEAPLAAAVTATLTAIDARAKARAERASVASDVSDWKDGINKLRTSTFAELLRLSTERSHSKAWVEAFFPSVRDAKDEVQILAEEKL